MPQFARFAGMLLAVFALLPLGVVLRAAEFKVGPDTGMDSLSVVAGTSSYFVVWRDIRALPAVSLRGCFVSQTGVSSPDVELSATGAQVLESRPQTQSVAFDGERFAVVWADDRSGAPGVYFQRVNPDGTLFGAELKLAPLARNSGIDPQVVFSGGDMVVAWHDTAPSSVQGASQISWCRVEFDNSVGPVQQIPLADAASSQRMEFLTVGAQPEVLLTFGDTGVSPPVTRALRILGDNTTAPSPAGLYLFQNDFSPRGFGRPVSVERIGSEYIILSSLGTHLDSTLFRTRLTDANTVLISSTPFIDVPQGTTNLAENDFPRTFLVQPDLYLFPRNIQVSTSNYHVLTKRVTTAGVDLDPTLPQLDAAPQGVLDQACAAAIGNQALVVWLDGRREPAQPASHKNIYGALQDLEVKGDETKPLLKVIARAAPIIGESPLVTNFGAGGSTGIVDNVIWDFGDGKDDDLAVTQHKYEAKGDYTAVLSLVRQGLAYRDFVRIFVDSDSTGGLNGGPQAVAGSLGPNSPGVNPDITLTSSDLTRNFSAANLDQARLFGYVTPTSLPFSVEGRAVSVSFGTRTYSFTLKADGTFTSEATAKPQVRFILNRANGAFLFLTGFDDLSSLEPQGLDAGPATKKTVSVPVSFTFNGLNAASTIDYSYTVKAGKSGKASYSLGTLGALRSGFFRVFSASAKENGKTIGARTHSFQVLGNALLDGGVPLEKAATGAWRVSLGNYSEDIPVEKLEFSNNLYTYRGPGGVKGVSQFFYQVKTGRFGVLFSNLDAEGSAPSGMPLFEAAALRVDLAFNVRWDLATGGTYEGSGFARFFRKKINSKKWQTR